MSNSWNGIKSGVGTAGQYLQKGWNATKSGIGAAGKYLQDNGEAIATIGGASLSTLGKVTANPYLIGAGAALTGGVNAYRAYKNYKSGIEPLQNVPEGEAKKALIQNIQERQPQANPTNKIYEQMNDEMRSFEGMLMQNQKKNKYQPVTRRKQKYG